MALPDDLLFIRLKFDGRCRACGEILEAGTKAHWSRSAQAVWCDVCEHVGRAEPENAGRGVRHPAGSAPRPPRTVRPDDPWRRLCRYARRCIEAEAARSLAPYSERETQWFFHAGREELVVGTRDTTAAPAQIATVLNARAASDRRSLIYGWPMVVVIDRHQPKVAPLFVLEVEPEHGPRNEFRLHAEGEPEFNRALTVSGDIDPDVADEIRHAIGDGLPFGDAAAMTAIAAQTAGLLGLPILSPLDPDALVTQAARRPGVYNAAISVATEIFAFDDHLIDELRELETRDDWADTAAVQLVPAPAAEGSAPASVTGTAPGSAGDGAGGGRPTGPLAAPLDCNHAQEATLDRLRRNPLTVVTGPPGTGKTQLVINAVTNAWLDGADVLVTSTNNAAVDTAVDRADRDICPGLLIRTGNRTMRQEVPDRITAAAAQPAPDAARQAAARARLQQTATERTGLTAQLDRLDALDARLLELADALEQADAARADAARVLWPDGRAPELAVDLRAIERRARAVRRSWCFRGICARRLRRQLGCVEAAPVDAIVTWTQRARRHAALAREFNAARAERDTLQDAIGDPAAAIRRLDAQWKKTSLDAIRTTIAAQVHAGAGDLAVFRGAPAGGDRFTRAVGTARRVLRGWACTTLSAHANFPLDAALFDLVIVDEASQCSLAAVLPLAYRARRLAVVGDPNQLPPIVHLGNGLLQRLALETGLDSDDLRRRGIHHKDGSAYLAFEFAAEPGRPALLDEHYRCHPHIARWFNRTFYNDDLHVLTEVAAPAESAARHRTIAWQDVDGAAHRPDSGRSWQNRAEAERTVARLDDLLTADARGSVGVITPFAAQAQLIQRLADERFDPDALKAAGFLCGTAHRLQGQERDAIVMSTVLSPGMPANTMRWVERERNLLNVAVSRARSSLIVLGHPAIGDLGSPTLASLRAHLRERMARQGDADRPTASFRVDSGSEARLLSAMQLRDLLPLAKLEVEGYELDFALMERGIRLNIEVDGDQHLDVRGRQRRQDLTRDRVLTRLGWTVLRIPAWRCYAATDAVLDDITATRDRLLAGPPPRA